MLHRLLEWDFYASVLKENPPAPENKSMNLKKYIFVNENSPLVRADYKIIKITEVIALLLFTQSLFTSRHF